MSSEQELDHESPELKLERDKVVSVVVATNAEITNEQFKKLMAAIGKEVRLEYQYQVEYRWEDEPPTDFPDHKTFKLEDFNFVTDPKTGKRFLAFFRATDGHTYYPRWCELQVFEDKKFVDLKNLVVSRSNRPLWSFKNPGRYVSRDTDSEGLPSDDIFKAIIEHSEKATVFRKKGQND